MADDDDAGGAPESELQVLRNSAFLLQLVCLASAFVIGLVIKHYRIRWLHEAGASLLLGVGVGLVMWSANTTDKVTRWLDFNEEVFFFLLLPPIIFDSGFSLHTRDFFNNFDGICALAFVGTAVSTVTVGLIVWLAGAVGLCTGLPFLHALIFGSLISATDPVTVLAIFQELGVNIDLYSLVFGESVLNDAVAIVLYRTLLEFETRGVTFVSLLGAVAFFAFIFVGSMLVGTFFAVVVTVFFKFMGGPLLESHTHIETSLVMIAPYCAYATAEALSLSGIVAILFCGIVMAHYTQCRTYPRSRRGTRRDVQGFGDAGGDVRVSLHRRRHLPRVAGVEHDPLRRRRPARVRRRKGAERLPGHRQDQRAAEPPEENPEEPRHDALRQRLARRHRIRTRVERDPRPGGIQRPSDTNRDAHDRPLHRHHRRRRVPRPRRRPRSQGAERTVRRRRGGRRARGRRRRRVRASAGGGGGGGGGEGTGGGRGGFAADATRSDGGGAFAASASKRDRYADDDGPDEALMPEFRVDTFDERLANLPARLGEVRHADDLDLRGKVRAAADLVGRVANAATFEDIDNRFIRPYLTVKEGAGGVKTRVAAAAAAAADDDDDDDERGGGRGSRGFREARRRGVAFGRGASRRGAGRHWGGGAPGGGGWRRAPGPPVAVEGEAVKKRN